jgi:hypothetical protein
MSMRVMICVLALLLTGCQAFLSSERSSEDRLPPIMPLWERYQYCLTTTDPQEFLLIINQFEQIRLLPAEPPAWMKSWGERVTSQPLRTTVDPQALAAACTLQAAAVLAIMGQARAARALYERVITRYPHTALTYYVTQANKALARLAESDLHWSRRPMPLLAEQTGVRTDDGVRHKSNGKRP